LRGGKAAESADVNALPTLIGVRRAADLPSIMRRRGSIRSDKSGKFA
jgi:hypothetical protein